MDTLKPMIVEDGWLESVISQSDLIVWKHADIKATGKLIRCMAEVVITAS